MIKFIKADGTEKIKVQSEVTLEEAQEFVGGWVELVHLRIGGQLLVNEEGFMLKLPVNETATRMYNGVTPIVGNAIHLTNEHMWR